MAFDIGLRVGVEGAADLKRSVSKVNEEIKTLSTEMKLVASQFIGNEDSMEAYAAKSEVLSKQIDKQNEKIELLSAQLAKAKENYGENNTYVLKLQQDLNKATIALNKMNAEFQQNQTAMENFGKAAEDPTAELSKEFARVEDTIKTLSSEMKLVSSEFLDAGDSVEAYAAKGKVLQRQVEAQEQKLELLRKQLDATTAEYGEGDARTQKYRREVNDTTAELNKLRNELKKNENAMDNFGDETKEASSKISNLFNDIKDEIGKSNSLGSLLVKGFAVGTVVSGIKEIGGAVFELVDSTQEYRTIMASLESSSQRAGYTADETAATYERLQGVLGDSQTAATATANLQALGLSQDQLTQLTNSAIGAWATYGDSIPIDGLAEAINETVQAGQVTGSFADVLNWAGVNEDEFNEKLAAASTASERANIVMQELARQGLAEAGQGWIDNNQDIVQANQATDNMDAALARLGEKFAPLASGARNFAADVINGMIDAGEDFVGWTVALPGQLVKVGGDLLTGLWNGINDKVAWLKGKVKGVVDKIKGWFTGSDGFDTHSPSKWSEGVFKNVMQGGAIGVNRGTPGLMRSVDGAVNSVKHDLSGIPAAEVPVNARGGTGQSGGMIAADIAQAMKNALQGAAVYMDGKKVGQLVTTQQNNDARSRDVAPVYG